jgi:hypothetical protein
MTADGLRLLQDLRRSLLDRPRQLRPRTATTTRDNERPRMSAPPPNITMNRNAPVPLHRIPDATLAFGHAALDVVAPARCPTPPWSAVLAAEERLCVAEAVTKGIEGRDAGLGHQR